MTNRADSPELIPSEKALLAELASLMTDERLRYIARADRGENAAEHFEAVQEIRDTYEVPAEMDWVPREVLELIRWSQPEYWFAEKNVVYRDHYEMRAFACSVLMLQSEAAESWDSGAETLGNLMESLIRYCPQLLPLVPDALDHFAAFDFHEADHAFRLAAELCVWLELEDGGRVARVLAELIDMESVARQNRPARAKDYGKPTAFAGVRTVIQAEGWHCVGKLMADRALIIAEEEPRFLVSEIAKQLQAIKSPVR